MPKLGELAQGKSLGYRDSSIYRWSKCILCSKERWVRHYRISLLCSECSHHQPNEIARRKNAERSSKRGISKHASKLGLKGNCYLYLDYCPSCNKELWRPYQQLGRNCVTCRQYLHGLNMHGENNPRWTGGRRKSRTGYIIVTISPDSPYFAMADKSTYTIKEHRLTIAKHLGRCLESWEIVHHKNGKRDDNRLVNLELLPNRTEHMSSIRMEQRIRNLEDRITLLEAENALLKGKVTGRYTRDIKGRTRGDVSAKEAVVTISRTK